MTQNEVDILKNAVLDATEAYVDARLNVLDFVKTQIGVTVGNPTTINPKTNRDDGKYRHTVRCNATQANPKGITYTNVLSVGNTKFPPDCVVFIVAPNAQFSNQFILGQLDDTPCNIVGGSIRLGGTNESNAPIYLTSEKYTYDGEQVYGHIGGFYITQSGLRIKGDDFGTQRGGKTIIQGDKIVLTHWKGNNKIGMAIDTSNDYIAVNANADSSGGVVVSDQEGWDGDGNFKNPTSSNARYTKMNVNSLEVQAFVDGAYRNYYITPQAFKFLDYNQNALAYLVIDVDSNGITFGWNGHYATLNW